MSPRIASLLPAGTDLVRALGAGSDLVGVSHACEAPAQPPGPPVLTRSRVTGGDDRSIDDSVRALREAGEELFHVDVEALRRAAPHVVVTQALCDVCAVAPATARAAIQAAGLGARLAVLHADSLEGVKRDTLELGAALGRLDVAREVARAFEDRLAAVGAVVEGRPRPRVASLEWLDPPFAAGHWVPQMVERAGGREVLGVTGRPSRRVTWHEVEEADPDVLCVVPCGYDLPEATGAWRRARERLRDIAPGLVRRAVVLLDADALVGRPGPRLARGVEVLAGLLHPGVAAAPSPEEGVRLP